MTHPPTQLPPLKLHLTDPNPELCAAWRASFADLPGVTIQPGRFGDLAEWDCIVAAGNSFGLMDGGLDLAIAQFFGERFVARVKAGIREEFLGEQPIGTSLLIETGDAQHPWVAHTPTMRVPMRVARTDYAYLAMWAMLLAVRKHNQSGAVPPIRTIVCPGLCTATGRMEPQEAARQMALAYRNFLYPPTRIGWETATKRQDALGRGGDFAFVPSRSFLKKETSS